MRVSGIVLVGLCSALIACSSNDGASEHAEKSDASAHEGHDMMAMELSDKAVKDKSEATELLIERFGVDACGKADLIGSLRRTHPEDGVSMMRGFKVSVACAEATVAAATKLGFQEDEPGTFTTTAPDGAPEEVKVDVIGDGAAATIEWTSDK